MGDKTQLDPKLEAEIAAALAGPAPDPPTRCKDCGKKPGNDRFTFGLCDLCFIKCCNSDDDYYDLGDDYDPFYDGDW